MLAIVGVLLQPQSSAAKIDRTLRVLTNFPGGSGRVLLIDQAKRRIRITPKKQPRGGWASWWYVQVTGLQVGETIQLEVGKSPWATPRQASVSDDGSKWRRSAPGKPADQFMTYSIRASAAKMFFAWGPPFQQSRATQLLKRAAGAISRAKVVTICRTRERRSVQALSIQAEDHRYGVWVQARQHAWEVGSSWVCEGLIEWLVSRDPRAREFRKHASVMVVPIVDADSVADGLGGKEQRPRDHNRDWSENPHWPYVAAAMAQLKHWNKQRRLDLFIDLHNPAATSTAPFFLVPPRKRLATDGRRRLDLFLAACRLDLAGPLKFRGQSFESGPNYDHRWKTIAKNWVALHCRSKVVSVTLETPWNTSQGTSKGYRLVGRGLAIASHRYLFKMKP